MQILRSRLAILLLLCFVRVLLPEAWVLELHAHQHTTEEPTQQPGKYQGKKLLSVKHQHCAVDSFYDVPFQPTTALELPVPFFTYARPETTAGSSVWLSAMRATADLRGPPRRS